MFLAYYIGEATYRPLWSCFTFAFLLMSFLILLPSSSEARAEGVMLQRGSYADGPVDICASGRAVLIDHATMQRIVNRNGIRIGACNCENFCHPNGMAAILHRVAGASSYQIAGLLIASDATVLDEGSD